MWVYRRKKIFFMDDSRANWRFADPETYEVGFFDKGGFFEVVAEYYNSYDAVTKVNYLNGGNGYPFINPPVYSSPPGQ